MNRDALLALADRVGRMRACANSVDVMVEVALFEPDEGAVTARSNSVGTKVIYTRRDGSEVTHWAPDWTSDAQRSATAAALRARAQMEDEA